MAAQIARDKRAYHEEWLAHTGNGRVSPVRFFDELRRQTPNDAIAVVDDGNHTYLTAELFPVHHGGRLIVPTDFNAMGYAVPAAIGAKLACPEKEVFAIAGDGAFMMSCMEIVTAAMHGLPIVYYVFHDGELAQIAQAQEIPYNRKPCVTLGRMKLEGVAQATGAAYVGLLREGAIESAISRARELAAQGRPVIVDVSIDYSKRTAFTKGTMKTNYRRFPVAQRARMAARALRRKITG
jgi:acetolactate synthase-1/2/3 large subunit